MDIKSSPIFYMGNKERLIKIGLTTYFPANIDTFYELFGGSGVVSLNTKANRYMINDIDKNLYDFYKMFSGKESENILAEIKHIINTYSLKEGIHKQGFSKKNPNSPYPTEEQNFRKNNYNNFRDIYNKSKNTLYLYILSIFSNSHNIRFNSNGEFNMSIGNSGWCEHHKQEIVDFCEFLQTKNISLFNKDFRELDLTNLSSDDFIYIDQPYLNTLAIYNEQMGWSINDDLDLFNLCEDLNNRKIKFAMSNVFKNREIKNEHLIEWCDKNKWNVIHFNDFAYVSCGKGNSKPDEVLIKNY